MAVARWRVGAVRQPEGCCARHRVPPMLPAGAVRSCACGPGSCMHHAVACIRAWPAKRTSSAEKQGHEVRTPDVRAETRRQFMHAVRAVWPLQKVAECHGSCTGDVS